MRNRAEPTKTNLIRLKGESALAKSGLEILDRKREILLKELSAAAAVYEKAHGGISAKLKVLYARYEEAMNAIGPAAAAYETIPLPGILSIRAGEKRIMGVKIPQLSIESINVPDHPLSPEIDVLSKDLAALLPEIISYIEIVCSMRRIAREVSKTQKREKAIEEIHLPAYRREIIRITEALDENERGELSRYKTLKKRLSAG